MDAFLAHSGSVAAALVTRGGQVLETNPALDRRGGTHRWFHQAVAPGQASIVAGLIADAGTQWRSVQAGLARDGEDPVDCTISAIAHRDHVLVLAEQLCAPSERLQTLLLEMNDDLLRARRELAAQNRRLRELDELKSMFLASASHDLRQPLTSLLGYAELLGEQSLPPVARRMTGVILRNAARMTAMIDDLLDAATIMTGELHLDLRWTDVAELARAAVVAVEPAARAGGVTCPPPASGSVLGLVDQRRVLQILDNLLSNAVKYTPAGGRVTVECHSEAGVITISVTDTGIGVAPAEREQLFERYFRASTAAAHGIDGTGLGLANARSLAEAHGGTLTCTASVPGTGSTFTLVLPEGSPTESPSRAPA